MNVEEIKAVSLPSLIAMEEFPCSCGKKHRAGVKRLSIGKGAINELPAYLEAIGSRKPFLLSGQKTFEAAGEQVCRVLASAGIPYSKYVFPKSPVKPTEFTVGSAVMHFDYSCDSIVGVGSGVINDTAKLLARATGREYIAVATAPSMDGFVSGTSSMDRDGLKVSLYSKAPWGVIGDLDILCNAPMHLLRAGVGDMLAKITSLREWELAKIIVGEEYCPVTAALVQRAVDRVMGTADMLESRAPEAVSAVMEGLLMAGIAMNYAGVSRPASGMEHYFSHIWDMRSLAFPASVVEQHGIQAGMGTLYTIEAYEIFVRACEKVDHKKAISYAASFSPEDWNCKLRAFVGPGAEAMIEGEQREHKYDVLKHQKRLEIIEHNWDEIVHIIKTLPASGEVRAFMEALGIPSSASVIGYTQEQLRTTFKMTKDIRDKYVGSRLFWDLGVLDSIAEELPL